MAAFSEEQGQRARLFPITGIGGPAEQERRAASALLAVIEAVTELHQWIGAMVGAPSTARCTTFIETSFDTEGGTFRPDGLIRFHRGKRRWTALVEVKTERNRLVSSQLEHYLEIAHAHHYDAVISVSQELPATPGVHPIAVPKAKQHGVEFLHLSWTEIRTRMQTLEPRDADQEWLRREYLRYLEAPNAGTLDFDDMGPNWVPVRDMAKHDTRMPTNPATRDVVRHFDQVIAYTASVLTRQRLSRARPHFNEADSKSEEARIKRAAAALARTKCLSGYLDVGAIAPIEVVADLAARQVRVSITVAAPPAVRPRTRVNRLLSQIALPPAGLRMSAHASGAREPGVSHLAKTVRDNPMLITDEDTSDIDSFALTLEHPMGLRRRGTGRDVFINSVVALVETFYTDVVEHLKAVPPPVTALQKSPDEAAVSDGAPVGLPAGS